MAHRRFNAKVLQRSLLTDYGGSMSLNQFHVAALPLPQAAAASELALGREIGALKVELEGSKTKVEDRDRLLGESKDTIAELEAAAKAKEEALEQKEEEAKEIRSEIGKCNAALADATAEIEALKTELHVSKTRVEESERVIGGLKATEADVKNTLKAKEEAAKEMQKALTQKDDEMKEQKKLFESTLEQRTKEMGRDIEAREANVEHTLEAAADEVQRKRKEIESLAEALVKKGEAQAKLQKQIQDYAEASGQKEEVVRQLNECRQETQTLKAENEKTRQEISELTTSRNALLEAIQKAKDEGRTVAEQLEKCNSEKAAVKTELATLSHQKNKVAQDLKQCLEETVSLKAKREELALEIDQAKKEVETVVGKLKVCNGELARLHTERAAEKSGAEEKDKATADLTRRLQKSEERNQKLLQEKSAAEGDATARKTRIEQLEKELSAEKENTTKIVRENDERQQRYEATIRGLGFDITQKGAQLDAAARQNDALRQELEANRRALQEQTEEASAVQSRLDTQAQAIKSLEEAVREAKETQKATETKCSNQAHELANATAKLTSITGRVRDAYAVLQSKPAESIVLDDALWQNLPTAVTHAIGNMRARMLLSDIRSEVPETQNQQYNMLFEQTDKVPDDVIGFCETVIVPRLKDEIVKYGSDVVVPMLQENPSIEQLTNDIHSLTHTLSELRQKAWHEDKDVRRALLEDMFEAGEDVSDVYSIIADGNNYDRQKTRERLVAMEIAKLAPRTTEHTSLQKAFDDGNISYFLEKRALRKQIDGLIAQRAQLCAAMPERSSAVCSAFSQQPSIIHSSVVHQMRRDIENLNSIAALRSKAAELAAKFRNYHIEFPSNENITNAITNLETGVLNFALITQAEKESEKIKQMISSSRESSCSRLASDWLHTYAIPGAAFQPGSSLQDAGQFVARAINVIKDSVQRVYHTVDGRDIVFGDGLSTELTNASAELPRLIEQALSNVSTNMDTLLGSEGATEKIMAIAAIPDHLSKRLESQIRPILAELNAQVVPGKPIAPMLFDLVKRVPGSLKTAFGKDVTIGQLVSPEAINAAVDAEILPTLIKLTQQLRTLPTPITRETHPGYKAYRHEMQRIEHPETFQTLDRNSLLVEINHHVQAIVSYLLPRSIAAEYLPPIYKNNIPFLISGVPQGKPVELRKQGESGEQLRKRGRPLSPVRVPTERRQSVPNVPVPPEPVQPAQGTLRAWVTPSTGRHG